MSKYIPEGAAAIAKIIEVARRMEPREKAVITIKTSPYIVNKIKRISNPQEMS